ncbi:hypothetical protein ACGFYQ_34515 [Streptomyces sp. NPDC048258]|uniref:hypothetical protein n=1 Tax=Streptomyces sp. NPDC048258 TaxID=3365527 RepID=UPI003723C102
MRFLVDLTAGLTVRKLALALGAGTRGRGRRRAAARPGRCVPGRARRDRRPGRRRPAAVGMVPADGLVQAGCDAIAEQQWHLTRG